MRYDKSCCELALCYVMSLQGQYEQNVCQLIVPVGASGVSEIWGFDEVLTAKLDRSQE